MTNAMASKTSDTIRFLVNGEYINKKLTPLAALMLLGPGKKRSFAKSKLTRSEAFTVKLLQ